MKDLRALLDAARAADEKVNGILAEMSQALEEGTQEGVERALALRDSLDAAKAEAEQANEAYVSTRDAMAEADENARKFVPVSDEAEKAAGKGKTLTRAEYEKLPYEERHAFFKAGGALVDELAE